MFQYIELYAGPEYLIQLRYSSLLVIIFSTFMYGLFIPILFPIALVAVINYFIVE